MNPTYTKIIIILRLENFSNFYLLSFFSSMTSLVYSGTKSYTAVVQLYFYSLLLLMLSLHGWVINVLNVQFSI